MLAFSIIRVGYNQLWHEDLSTQYYCNRSWILTKSPTCVGLNDMNLNIIFMIFTTKNKLSYMCVIIPVGYNQLWHEDLSTQYYCNRSWILTKSPTCVGLNDMNLNIICMIYHQNKLSYMCVSR